MTHNLLQVTILLSFSFHTSATRWIGADPTPSGFMAQAGISLRPTEAPGLNGIPKELLRRQVPFPPPQNWCGFVDNQGSDPLSCSADLTCVYSGDVMGCCGVSPISACTNIYTTCADYTHVCDGECMGNYNILKCGNSEMPYCGTYNFGSGTRLYNCQSYADQIFTVEFLADYYLQQVLTLADTAGPVTITAVAQTLVSVEYKPATTVVISVTGISSIGSAQTSTLAAPVSAQSQSSSQSGTTSHSGIPLGAIIGIAVGAAIIVLLVIAGLVAFCCIKRRIRRRRMPGHSLPVEHHFPPIQKPIASVRYAAVLQQEQTHANPEIMEENKAFDLPPPFTPIERKPVGADLSPNPARFSSATVSSQSTHSPYIPQPSMSEVDGDIYRGAPSHHVEEVEAISPPLNSDGQRSHELGHIEHEISEPDGLYEMSVQGARMGPLFSGPYEMETMRYGQ